MQENILVKVGSDITGLSKGLAQANDDLTKFGDKARASSESFKKVGTMATGAGIVIAAGLGSSVKIASDWQSAFAGVRKTVDTNEEGFAILAEGIRDMSKELPASANEIAGVAESAGQLGIAEENILSFSKTMIDLGESTNLTADQAATAFARFANITQMPQTDFEKLGSVVVDLGNNMATTEGEIVDMSMRLAAQGKQVGMSESDIMALAGTMSSLGIESEAGGSAMTTVLTKMQSAVAGGSAELDAYAKAADMSASEFAESFKNDPITALEQLTAGLGASAESGGNMNTILDDLGIKGIREADVMKRLAGNSELLGGAVDIANGAWEANTALTDEASQRYETFASKSEILGNKFKDLAITVGEALLPTITTLVEMIGKVVDWISNLNPKILASVAIFIAIAAAVLLVVGPILVLIGFLPAIIAGFTAVSAAVVAAGGVLGILGTVFAALTGPIALIIAAIIGIIAVLVLAYNKVGWFRDMVNTAWAAIVAGTLVAFNYIKEVITAAMADIKSFVGDVLAKLQAFWAEHGESITTLVKGSFEAIWATIESVMGYILGIFETVWPIISGAVKIAWELIQLTVSNGLDIILGLVGTVMDLLEGDWEGAWDNIKGIAEDIWGNIEGFFESVDLAQIGADIIQGLIDGIGSMASGITTMVSAMADLIPDWLKKKLGIASPSKVTTKLGMYTGMGLVKGLDGEAKSVEKSAQALANASIAKPTLSYDTPGGSYGSFSSALSGQVDVSVAEQSGLLREIVAAVREGQVISLDGRKVGESVASTVKAKNDRVSAFTRNGNGGGVYGV